jgi:hypothetical protein
MCETTVTELEDDLKAQLMHANMELHKEQVGNSILLLHVKALSEQLGGLQLICAAQHKRLKELGDVP